MHRYTHTQTNSQSVVEATPCAVMVISMIVVLRDDSETFNENKEISTLIDLDWVS